jgi:hypothetical protein
MRVLLGLLAFCLSVMSYACAMPGQVLIIRHAEKPAQGNSLSLKGKERAAALAPFFIGTPELLTFGAPIVIYAQRPSNQEPSLRPVETVKPLGMALDSIVLTTYSHDEINELVEEIKTKPEYQMKMVLICWEHHDIPQIAKAFGKVDCPKKWNDSVFDRVWMLIFNQDETISFKDMPQQLMYGDSNH